MEIIEKNCFRDDGRFCCCLDGKNLLILLIEFIFDLDIERVCVLEEVKFFFIFKLIV